MSRAVQDRLLDLERRGAPIGEQIHQAALLSGCALISPNISYPAEKPVGHLRESGVLHGWQEYVLRWLLKKLQVQEARQCCESWSLLALLIGSVPTRNVARVLSERNFMVLLRQAIEEAVIRRRASDDQAVPKEYEDESSDTVRASPLEHISDGTISAKRKRYWQPSPPKKKGSPKDDHLCAAIYETTKSLVQLTEPRSSVAETFISDHIKSVIRTTSEEAARLLEGWLKLCQNWESTWTAEVLSPFIEIWNRHVQSDDDLTLFSKYCLQPSLNILCAGRLPSTPKAQLETLLARHVISPVRKDHRRTGNLTTLEIICVGSVSESPLFAPILFDIVIRCLQPRGPRPRRSEDSAWLQLVFSTINQSMSGSQSELHVTAMTQMLQISITHKVVPDLPLLQVMTTQYGLTAQQTNWDIIVTIMELDASVFLLPRAPNDLLNDLLSRITTACTEPSWPIVADKVVGDILVPLVRAFAKARQLSVFINLWYDNLVVFESLGQSEPARLTFYCAWEDEALQSKLVDLLETSLTNPEITALGRWLKEKIVTCEGAMLVLMEAIAGAIFRDETIAVFGPNLVHLDVNSFNLNSRYRPRIWRLAKASLHWPTMESINRSQMDIYLVNHLQERMAGVKISSDSFLNLEMLEMYRYMCALWSSGKPSSSSEAATSVLNYLINGLAAVVSKLAQDIKTGQASGEMRWGSKLISLRRDAGWFICAYIYCTLVEYPKVLELFPQVPNSIGSVLLKDVIWIASTTTSFTAHHGPTFWLRINHDILPGIWMTMLQNEYCFNNPSISRQVIEAMLDCKSHQDNPIDKSSACNGFIIKCLHQVPLEVLSKGDRIAVLHAWQPERDPEGDEVVTLSDRMAPLDPAVLSLKVKMMLRPSLSDGIQFQDLVDLAKHIDSESYEPQVLVPIFGKLVELTLGQVFESIGQPKRQQYFHGMITKLNEWITAIHGSKKPPSNTMTRLLQEVMVVLSSRSGLLDSSGTFSKEDLNKMRVLCVDFLLIHLRLCLERPEKIKDRRVPFLFSAMDALDAIVGGDITRPLLKTDLQAMISSVALLKQSNPELGRRLEIFLIQHYPDFLSSHSNLLDGDVSSTSGRNSIEKKSQAMAARLEGPEKLDLIISLVKESVSPYVLDKMLTLRHVISTCEDLRPVKADDNSAVSPSLSLVFTLLVARLGNSKGVREFCLLSETMEMMLRTKPRSIRQYNIDSTLSAITILCTRSAPSLRPSCCGTIYSHLLRLFHTVLTSHRLKVQGHLHLVAQTSISLLRCLFTPSGSGGRKSTHPGSAPPPPPWLSPAKNSKMYQLSAKHAQSYSRLLSLLCDPSPSPTSHSSQPSLHDSSKLAKQSAGLYMDHVLLAYIRWTLDMSLSMKHEVREALVPGWWAVLDAMGRSGRRLAGERMDSSGRVVLAGLVRDWRSFGEWKG